MLIDSAISTNPFAILTSIVAPAVLTNACSVMSLGTGNRIARVVDQTRRVRGEMESAAEGSDERHKQERQLRELSARSKLLISALRLFYIALGSFAAAALIALLGASIAAFSETGFRVMAVLGLLAGFGGVCCLVWGCVTLVREVRIALEQTAEFAAEALSPS